MSRDASVPLDVFLRKCVPNLSPGAAISIPPEILKGGRPPTAEELVVRFPPMRVVLEFPNRDDRYFLRAKRRRRVSGGTRLVVDRLPASDIFADLTDHQRGSIYVLLKKFQSENARMVTKHRRQRPKRFLPTKKKILLGGRRVNPEANKAALIARSHAILTGSFTAPDAEEDSAS
jgi:hypothetical protein